MHLWVVVPQGYGDKRNPIFLDIVFFDNDAQRVITSNVKKHSLIEITGDIEEIEAYVDKESGKLRTALKIRPYHWQFVPSSKVRGEPQPVSGGKEDLPPPEQLECSPDGRMPV